MHANFDPVCIVSVPRFITDCGGSNDKVDYHASWYLIGASWFSVTIRVITDQWLQLVLCPPV